MFSLIFPLYEYFCKHMHKECPVYHFLPIYVVIDQSKTVFKLIKDKKEVGVTLLTAISLYYRLMAALKAKLCA